MFFNLWWRLGIPHFAKPTIWAWISESHRYSEKLLHRSSAMLCWLSLRAMLTFWRTMVGVLAIRANCDLGYFMLFLRVPPKWRIYHHLSWVIMIYHHKTLDLNMAISKGYNLLISRFRRSSDPWIPFYRCLFFPRWDDLLEPVGFFGLQQESTYHGYL